MLVTLKVVLTYLDAMRRNILMSKSPETGWLIAQNESNTENAASLVGSLSVLRLEY